MYQYMYFHFCFFSFSQHNNYVCTSRYVTFMKSSAAGYRERKCNVQFVVLKLELTYLFLRQKPDDAQLEENKSSDSES